MATLDDAIFHNGYWYSKAGELLAYVTPQGETVYVVGAETNTVTGGIKNLNASGRFIPVPAMLSSAASFEALTINKTAGVYNFLGYDTVTGTVFIKDDGGGVLRIGTSSNEWATEAGITWSNSKGLPSSPNAVLYSGCAKVIRFKNKIYLLAQDSVTGIWGVYRADPTTGNTAFTWSAPVKQMNTPRWSGTASFSGTTMTITGTTSGTNAIGQSISSAGVPIGTYIVSGTGPYTLSASVGTISSQAASAGASALYTTFTADDNYMYLAEYGDPGTASGNGPTVWRTSDGDTWDVIYTESGLTPAQRHVHAIASDPYNAGHLWMTLGDANAAREIMRSTDYGANWSVVSTQSKHQAVQISFTQDWVYMAGDSSQGLVLAVDRATNAIYWAAAGRLDNIAVPAAAASTDKFYGNAWYGVVDPNTGEYYCTANDATSGSNTPGVFVVPFPGAAPVLLEKTTAIASPIEIAAGYLWVGRYRRKLHTI